MPAPLRYDKRLERYPPILCRLCCTRGRQPHVWCPTDSQIAMVARLPLSTVKWMSWLTTWDPVENSDRRAFLAALDIDLENRAQLARLEYMRRRGQWRHLHTSELWQIQFEEMVTCYVKSVEELSVQS